MCRAASHAAVFVDVASPAGLGSSTALGITGATSVAFGLISRPNLSRHVVVRRDEAPKHSELPGVSPYLWMVNFEMNFFLFPVISSLANSLGFLCTPVKFVNAFRCCSDPAFPSHHAHVSLSALTQLWIFSSSHARCDHRTDWAHVPRTRQSATVQCSRCQLGIRTTLATRNHWLSLTFRCLSQHSHLCHSTDANTSDTPLPSSSLLVRPLLRRRVSEWQTQHLAGATLHPGHS